MYLQAERDVALTQAKINELLDETGPGRYNEEGELIYDN